MCSYYYIHIPFRNPGIDLSFFFCRLGTGEQNRAYTQPLILGMLCFYGMLCFHAYLKQSFIMLSGQDLCRRHKAALSAVGSAHQQGQKCQYGFSAAHIPLYQAVHGVFFLKILFYFLPDTMLCPGKPVGKIGDKPVRIRHLFQRLIHLPDLVFFLEFPESEEKFKKFIERKPSAGGD